MDFCDCFAFYLFIDLYFFVDIVKLEAVGHDNCYYRTLLEALWCDEHLPLPTVHREQCSILFCVCENAFVMILSLDNVYIDHD